MNAGLRPARIAEDRSATTPGRWQSAVFEGKASWFRWRRSLRELFVAPRRLGRADCLGAAPVLAEFRSSLWPGDETAPHLVAGKIHNLRVAARALDGREIAAGQVFSFWKQVGRARRWRGFVLGRELREGCLVPAIGGGLCQLSSALYDSAVRAGLDVVERHRHSRVVPGSLAESDRDATVFWNYLDLRFRAPWPWRLEVRMDARELRVRIRGHAPVSPPQVPLAPMPRTAVRTGDCSSCEETECHRHEGPQAFATGTTWLVEDDWPEFKLHRQAQRLSRDRVLDVVRHPGWRERIASLRAKAIRRWRLWRGQPLPQARLEFLQSLASAYARRLRYDDLHLVVPQALLPFLWQAGELNGRSFDVLMTALPMDELQRRLDLAAARHPRSPTLADFRADPAMVEAEGQALAQARHWITPHAEILRLAGARGMPLPWQLPPLPTASPSQQSSDGSPRVLLPASALARKGAIELRAALSGLPLRLLLPPGAEDEADFWRGLDVARVASIDAGVAAADVVALPAWIEHQPRGLLRAIALGKPVVATAACGLDESLLWLRVAEGDEEDLRRALLSALARD